jgi:hypothetical protein
VDDEVLGLEMVWFIEGEDVVLNKRREKRGEIRGRDQKLWDANRDQEQH